TAGRHTGGSSNDSQVGSVAKHPIAAAESVAAKLSAHNKATAAGKPDVAAAPKPVTAAPTSAVHAPSATTKSPTPSKPAAASDRMPTTLASALERRPVAVVLVYDPQVKVDRLSVVEAQLGAERANAS